MTLPIFDSLAHPSVQGTWLGKEENNKFPSLIQDLKQENFKGACVVGIAGKDGYSHESFIRECKKEDFLIPIAGFDPLAANRENELQRIKMFGFKGIKVHPRFSELSLQSDFDEIVETLRLARKNELVVFLCTYNHCHLDQYPETDPFYSLISLLKACPEAKIVLVHGGAERVLSYAEVVRFNPNLLLDLSLTIMKYEHSSIDSDIRFLFQKFDQRICVGTDYPEYSHNQLRKRFDYFSVGVPPAKLKNIAYNNLLDFLK